MGYYDLSKPERTTLVSEIRDNLLNELRTGHDQKTTALFGDDDTYIRKSAYQSVGRIYSAHPELQAGVIRLLETLSSHDNFKVRQTVISAAGEIGKKDFDKVLHFFDTGLIDEHHSPRNAVIGSIKKMGEVNPTPVLKWAKKYIHHPDKEIRREICHGIELRGRKHPQDILPLLKELQFDKTKRVRDTLVHVIGQIAYKKGCLPAVIEDIKTWENKELVADAIEEIIDVHRRYKNFSDLSQKEAREYISKTLAAQ